MQEERSDQETDTVEGCERRETGRRARQARPIAQELGSLVTCHDSSSRHVRSLATHIWRQPTHSSDASYASLFEVFEPMSHPHPHPHPHPGQPQPGPQPGQMQVNAPDPAVVAAIDAQYRPVALKLGGEGGDSAVLCEPHGNEVCATCGTDFFLLNQTARVLRSFPKEMPVPPSTKYSSPSALAASPKSERGRKCTFDVSSCTDACTDHFTIAGFVQEEQTEGGDPKVRYGCTNCCVSIPLGNFCSRPRRTRHCHMQSVCSVLRRG